MTFFDSLLKLLVLCELCSSEPDVYYANRTVFVGKNDTVELNCHRRQKFECGWHIPNQAIQPSMERNSTHKTYIQYNEGHLMNPKLKNHNIDIIGGNDTIECKLKIRNFSAVDEGIYTCKAWNLRTYTSYTNYNVHLKSSPSNLTINGVIMKNGMKVVRGVEGTKLTIVCTVENGKPATTLVLSLTELFVLREGKDRITYSFIPTRKDNLQSIVCSAKSTLLDNPLSLEVQLDIQYSPVVEITSRPTKHKLVLLCNPRGNPTTYIFGDWEHLSEFKEHIQNIEGAPDGTLTLLKSNNNKRLHETDGVYKCKASNGIYGTNRHLYQKGTALVYNKVPPIFLDSNKPIQIGRYGQEMNLTVILYNKYGTIRTAISKLNKTLYTETNQESIRTQDSFHDVNVTVSGVKITILLTLNKAEDFTDYTIKACNEIGCNKLTVKITSESRPEPPSYVSVFPYARYIEVVWNPGFDGGYKQTCFVEYQQEGESIWRRSGPIIDDRQVKIRTFIHELNPKTRYHVRLVSYNDIGESNKTAVTSVMTLSERPESPTIVSVIPYDRYLEVSWCPEYNGGDPQTFFIEYQQEASANWTRSGPIIDKMQTRMSNLLYNMTPNTRYLVRMFSRNEIGESEKTTVIDAMTVAERPESPTNVSVIPYDRHLEVTWCPEYNGGDPQTFFIEYQQESSEKWTRSEPIIDNMQTRMSNLLYKMTPNTRYVVRMFSRNEIGESKKTPVIDAMTLEPTINLYRVKAVFIVLLIMISAVLSNDVSVVVLIVLAVTVAVYGTITFFCLRRKEEDASDNYNPVEEEVRENFQVEPVDNLLYISSDDSILARAQNIRNQSILDTTVPSTSSDNQIYQMQLLNGGLANGRRSCTYINRGAVSAVLNPQIDDQNLNYSEITFNTVPTMRDAVIHGSVNRTIYSEIDLMADPVAPLSSSESEYDESDDSDT